MGKQLIKSPERWIIVGDTQVPFHNPAAVELAARIIEDLKPHHLIYNGDMIDFHTISSHQKRRYELLKSVSIQDEIDITIAVEDQLARGIHRLGKKYMIDGNHEERLERFLGTGPQSILGTLRDLELENVFSYDKRGFSEYYPYGEGKEVVPGLFVYHGTLVGSVPGYSVYKEVMSRGKSVVIGHSHRSAHLHIKQGDGVYQGIECGCLCQLAASYKPMTNWSWSIVIIETIGDMWSAEVIRFHQDKKVVYCIYRNKYYEVPVDLEDGMAVPWRPDKMKVYGG